MAVTRVPSITASSDPVAGIEECDQRLVRRQAEQVVLGKSRHQLHAETQARTVPGHRQQKATLVSDHRSPRCDVGPAGAEGAETFFQGVDELVEV